MRLTSKHILLAAALTVAATANAQNAETAYFTDGYMGAQQLNPAKVSDQGYIAFPAFGNLAIEMQSNFRVDNFIFNKGGKTVLFTNPMVTNQEFLGGIKDDNKTAINVKEQLFALGFKGLGGYNTLSFNTRVDAGLNVPGDIFRVVKEGLGNDTYKLGGMGMQANAYSEVVLGHAHKIGDKLSVGVNLKYLIGHANVNAKFNKADIALGEDSWDITTNAEVEVSLDGVKYETTSELRGPEGEQTTHTYVDGIDTDDLKPINGSGFAVDLGAEYEIMDGLKVSAAILDLGYIKYKNNMVASTQGDHRFQTADYEFNANDDASNSFEKEIDRMTEKLGSLYELKNLGDKGSVKRSLNATINAGVEYKMPFYDKLSVGGLYTQRMGDYGWYNARLSANIAPAKMFSASASLGVGTFGTSVGWIINLHPNGFNLFVAMDQLLPTMSKQFVPLNGNASLVAGINFPF